MICPRCNYPNPDNYAYCHQCGNQLIVQTPNNYEPYSAGYQHNFQPQSPIASSPLVRSPHPVLNVVKNCGASPLLLVAIIAYSVSILLDAVSSHLFMEKIEIEAIGYIIVITLPSILLACGMWMMFASAINKQNGEVNTAGLTIIKVIIFIKVAVYTFITICLEMGLLSSLDDGSTNNSASDGPTVVSPSSPIKTVIVYMLLIGAVFAIILMYMNSILKTINTIKNTSITGVVTANVSLTVSVFCFIIGLFYMAYKIASFVLLDDVWGVLAGVATATASICFGIFIIYYKQEMTKLITPTLNVDQNTNVFPQQPTQYAVQQNTTYRQP